MKNYLHGFITAVLLLAMSGTASSQNLWRKTTAAIEDTTRRGGHYTRFEIDIASLQSVLRSAPKEGSRTPGVTLALPKPTGGFVSFLLEETTIFTPSTEAESRVKTYTGKSEKGALVAHLTVNDNNIYGIVSGVGETWFIETVKTSGSTSKLVAVYDTKGRPFQKKPAGCDADGEVAALPNTMGRNNESARTPSASCPVKIYRIAMAGTADYTTYFGSQAAAFANTVAVVNNLNAIYEREMGIRFVLVTDQTLMYTDAAADPFTNSGATPCSELTISRTNFSSAVGAGNYDLGLTLYGQNFGGCAYVGATCSSNDNKGGAVAGYDNPTPGSYLLEVCAHEIGHLFGAGHTHNATGSGCTITSTSAWEPGGGSTIMAYSNCDPSFDSYNTMMYFHGGNLGQMRNYIVASGGCYTTGAANTSPLLTAATDNTFFIPISTPFRLYAEATDAEDQNTLSYTFEQMNLGTGSASAPSPVTASGPVFRSFEPSAKSFRYLPRMDSLVAGVIPTFESLPSVSRSLTFWTTVRDNRTGCGCQSVDTINVTTSGSTAFRVTSQSTPTTVNAGNLLTVTWDVAGTTGAPFNTANVQILFAGDGLNYTTILSQSTANDGTEQVTLPNIITSNGRIMVAAVGNIFFNINSANITIQTPCSDVQRSQLFPETAISAVQGSTDLLLTQTPAFGVASDGFDAEITAGDPTGIIGFRTSSTDPTCTSGSGFSGRYDAVPFYTVVPGDYEFTRTLGTLSGTIFFSLYGSGGFVPGNVCSNFLYSNVWRTSSGISFFNNFNYSLAANSQYAVAFEVRSTTAYGTYRVNVRGPGPIFTEFKNAGNSYSYVIVNNSGDIVAVTATPDLRTYAAGTYYVYGVSHSTALNLTTFNGQSFNNLLYGNFSAGSCLSLSNNRRIVEVIASSTLPVNYVQLTTATEGNSARLKWKVSDENETAGSSVEHSRDGVNFSSVATLAAGEARTANAEYQHLHRTPVVGMNFYRIKQFSRGGGWMYSNVASVNFTALTTISITPNPSKGQVTITTASQQRFVPFVLHVYNNKGQQVAQYVVNKQSFTVDLSSVPAGLYLFVGNGISERILKQ